ncbi:MAG: hypothetical protein JXR65_10110 [Bacteroidales bacterium]|nr:hypothetical protein [Bacteroidales bacterium]
MDISEELQNHWLWQDKPFAKGQAWIDIMILASNERTYFRGKVHTLPKGQFITSENTLCERWGWSRTKVRAFLQSLSQCSMISITSDAGKTIITTTQITEEKVKKPVNIPLRAQVKKQEEEHSKSFNSEKIKDEIIPEKKQVIKQIEIEKNNSQKTVLAPQVVQLSLIDAIEEKANEEPDKI